jgi:hypothetical protein
MARLSFPSRVVLVLLLAVILAGPALAAQPRPRLEARQGAFLTVFSELRVQIWRLLSGLWEKNGCSIDPHGGTVCNNGSTVVGTGQEKNGCIADPNGGSVCNNGSTVVVTDQVDEGCSLDPHGGCGR